MRIKIFNKLASMTIKSKIVAGIAAVAVVVGSMATVVVITNTKPDNLPAANVNITTSATKSIAEYSSEPETATTSIAESQTEGSQNTTTSVASTTSTPTITTSTTISSTTTPTQPSVPQVNKYGASQWGFSFTDGRYFTQQDDWLYISLGLRRTGYDNPIYKVKTDGTSLTEIFNTKKGVPTCLNVVGDWIYYKIEVAQSPEHGNLYRIKTDGTNEQRLNDDNWKCKYLIVVNDWIYFSRYYGETESDNTKLEICRMKTNGSSLQVLIDNSNWLFWVADEWIYYVSEDQNGMYAIYKMKLNGNDKQLLLDDLSNPVVPKFHDGWVYFQDDNHFSEEPISTYRIRSDGTGSPETLCFSCIDNPDNIPNIYPPVYINDGWYYYGVLWRCKVDGSGAKPVKVFTGEQQGLGFYDNCFYYIVFEGTETITSTIYKINVDGTGEQKLISIPESVFF